MPANVPGVAVGDNRVAVTRASRHAVAGMIAREHLEADMAFDPMAGLVGLETVLERLRDGAAGRGWPFDRHAVRNELQAATFRLREPRTVRLLVSETGTVAVEVSAI